MKKICSVLLCMLTVMNLFVGAMLTVSAVTQIPAVSISGVEVPRPGATPDYSVQGTGTYYPTYKFDGTYMKNGVAWLDVTDSNNIKSLKPTDTFVVGRKYRVSIVLEAHSDYEFAVSAGRINVVATVNGKSANTYDFNAIDIKRNIGVYYVFTCQNELITNVAANCVTPHEGQLKISLQNSASVDESRPYYVNGLLWTNLDSNGNTSYMKDSDKFTAGKSYRCEIYIRAKTGYVFNAANGDYFGNAKVNGKDAGYFVADMGDDPVIAMTLHYDITIPDPIKTVSVSGIDAPVAGETADTSAVVDGTGYKITNIEWWDTTQQPFKKVTSFESGRKYQLNVKVETVDNYLFNMDDGYTDITATVNGKSATAYGGHSDTEATIGGDYYTPIEKVAVSGIDVPVHGAKPDMTAETVDASYTIKDVRWATLTKHGSSLTVTELNANSVFEAGKTYRVCVTLERVAPYVFFCDPEDYNIQAISGTVNGNQAKAFSSYSETEADIYYEFTVPAPAIYAVVVSGIDAPVVGAKPDVTATAADSSYNVKAVEWYALTAGGVALKENKLSASSVFEAGKTYRVCVTLERVAPYVFFCDPEDEDIQNITATVNGKNVVPSSSRSETEALVALDFEKLPDAVVTPDDKLKFKADSAFSADHDARIAVLALKQTVEEVSAQIANEYFDVKANPSAEFVGTGSVITVKDQDGNTLSQYTVLVKYDVNGDGKVEPADARLALRAAVNLESFDGVKKTAADADGSAEIQPADARLILRKAVGLD